MHTITCSDVEITTLIEVLLRARERIQDYDYSRHGLSTENEVRVRRDGLRRIEDALAAVRDSIYESEGEDDE